ncbi:TPA: hypothetical protein SIF59_004273 [Escherichia coli]|nr:hypothetical protein [Escherichia coli]
MTIPVGSIVRVVVDGKEVLPCAEESVRIAATATPTFKNIAYALHDCECNDLYLFATSSDVLVKDGLMAYMEKQVFPTWSDVDDELKKDLLTAISGAADPAELMATLVEFGFTLKILAI